MDRDKFRPSPPSQVSCETTDQGAALVLVRVLRHPPATVWAALTDPARLAEWAPFLTDRDLGSPGPAVLTLVDGETREEHPATVRRAEPPHLLEYTWGDDLLRWELDPTVGGTRLTLRHTTADPGVVPSVAAGWHLCFDVADHLLDGDPVGPIRGAEAKEFGWPELRHAYAQRLGLD
ncbi:SRPBCC family protein [Micromonospora sp. WMMD812]|uniref:SRPBCC family protein n=1 Tax=Micromonospora sp. WMMD812 TaxID=3015152 RepID=UPI00248D2F7A|nr:SRPBCC family protein [Micromonospora sp. WMMD812]WBB67017.1 SRPBCC family protein [Micromonospora sp. WMMD812]